MLSHFLSQRQEHVPEPSQSEPRSNANHGEASDHTPAPHSSCDYSCGGPFLVPITRSSVQQTLEPSLAPRLGVPNVVAIPPHSSVRESCTGPPIVPSEVFLALVVLKI